MIPTRLVQAVADELREAVKDYSMAAEGAENKGVTVYAQHIPDEDFKTDTYYPLAIVSLQKTEDNSDGAIATLGFTFGVYGEDADAWQDLLSIMERVRQRLLTRRVVARRFRLLMPLVFETIEVQPYPYWFGYATAKYSFAQPSEHGWAATEGELSSD